MRKLLMLLPLLGLALSPGPKLNRYTLSWTPTPSPTATGYLLYWGGSSGNYTNTLAVSIGSTNLDLRTLNLPPAVYYFVMTSTNANAESGPSNEVQWDATFPAPPSTLTIK